MKCLTVLTCMAAVLLGVAACSSTTTGQPVSTTQAGGPTSTNSPSTPTSAGGSGTLPVSHPCSLLSSNDFTTLGASSAPTEEMVGTAHSCDFDSSDFSMGVGIRTNAGLADFQPPGAAPKNITVGSHQAKQQSGDTGACTVAIGVSNSSRVDVVVTPISTGDPCPIALQIANLVEPKLP